ncbi:MAG: hypothetical protein PVF91_16140 [Chromatiales bacterium]|jgi:hypothetical protein
MTRPGFLEGAVVALAAAAGGTIAHTALVPLLSAPTGVRAVVALLGLAYLLYLLARTRERVGRVTTFAAWSLVATLAWMLDLPLGLYVLVHLGAVWLVRSLYFHARPLAALADLGLTALAVAAAAWAADRTGSLFLTLWCLFLVQALFVAIPQRIAPRPGRARADDGAQEGFQRAHRAAESAVRRLSSTR